MNGVKAIIKKELRCYFYSPLAYVIVGVFLLIMGIIFAKFIQLYAQYLWQQRAGQGQDITLDKLASYLYQNMAFILCFITPFLTMRLFAEERKQQTLELLQTAPIKGWELVVGKYLSSFLLMTFMVSITFIYVFFMILWGNPEVPLIALTYLGLLLALGCYLAIGTLISSLTSSQAIAAVWTFIALLFLWLLQSISQGITARTGFIEWGPTLAYISPLQHFTNFTEGLLHLKDVIYFLTFTSVLLFITHKVVESNRWR